jgi:serine/threonine protein phosphatase PrpC
LATILHLHGLSDLGNKRLNNEDAWWAGQPQGAFASMETAASEPLRVPVESAPVLAIVSDGIGGANAGEVASQIAVNTTAQEISARREFLADVATARDALLHAMEATDAAVRVKAREPGFVGMGATLSILCFGGPGIAWWGQAGDSRIYLYRRNTLRQISHDHSPVGRLRQEGKISEEEARRHPMRNQIDQSLGDPNNPFRPDVASTDLQSGDVFLLCSDGLSDGLWERDIAERLHAVAGPADVKTAVVGLVDAAKASSGRDNITALVVYVEMPDQPVRGAAAQNPGRRLRDWWNTVFARRARG